MSTKRRSWLKAGPLALLLAAGLASPVLGQSITASVTGVVEDNQGGVLKGASVTAVNQKTGVEYPTKSNDAGVYTVTNLPIGTYTIKAEAAGFKTAVTNPFNLETNQIARVPLRLQLGAVTEELEVVGVNPLLQTESATVGEVISGSTAVALPLNGRNFAQLTLLVPGVQSNDPISFTQPGNQSGGRPNVNGHRQQSNNFILDGIDMNEGLDNLVAYNPSPDALAEVRVETNNYSAEFGNVAGAVVNSVMKSGGNELHGSAFEFMRNDAFDANSWGNKRAGAEKAELKQHIFGATLSGPIVQNKVFFFADYQGTDIKQPGGATIRTVPASLRAGATSPVAQRLFADTANYPLPTSGDIFAGTKETTTKAHQGDLKIDAHLSATDNVFVRFSVGSFERGDTNPIIPLAAAITSEKPSRSVALNWTHAFGSTAVNDLRVGFSQVKPTELFNFPGLGNYNATLGISGSQAKEGLSALNITGFDPIGSAATDSESNSRVYQLAEKFAFAKGRHYISVGAQVMHFRQGRIYPSNSGILGQFNFDSLDAFKSGIASSKSIGGSSPWEQRQERIGVFIQDDMKLSSSLTVNAGLRWEYTSPFREKDKRELNYDLTTGQALFAGEIPAGACVGHAAGCLANQKMYDAYYGGFSPRLGAAWSLDSKTVIRGGYGLVQYMEGAGANGRLAQNTPFVPADAGLSSPSNVAVGFSDVVQGSAGTVASGAIRYVPQDFKPQLTHQWNLFIERQITDSTSLNVGYVGHSASRVLSFRDHNQALPGVGDPCPRGTGPFCDPSIAVWAPKESRRPFKGVLPNVGAIRLTGSDATSDYNAIQASVRRRSKGVEFLGSYTFSKAMQDNNGFYGGGWGGTNPYTVMGNGGSGEQNGRDPKADRGPSLFDATHSFTFSLNYELPFGRGRSRELSGATNALLGGWNLSAILSARSGFPITVLDGPDRSLQTAFANQRPDRIGNGRTNSFDWSDPNSRWLDAASFRAAETGTFGDSGVGILRGPGYYNLDVGLDKNFSFGGSRALTFRIEAFNVLNHAAMGLPNNNWSDAANFGKIDYTVSAPRTLELALKFHF